MAAMPPYNFGLSQEDERTEAAALALGAGDRVLSIASAGEMPLSLLALGAERVTAVDIDPAQLHLTALKLAASRALEREAMLGFLGYVPTPGDVRRAALRATLPLLSDEARAYWQAREHLVTRGVIWQGRYERYIRRLVALVVPVLGRKRIEGLFATGGLDAQSAHFDREIGRPLVHAVFRIAFDPRIFGKRGMDPRSLQHRDRAESLGDQYFGKFRAFCTRWPARANHHLQLTLLGRLVDASATPACFTTEGIAALRERHASLRLVCSDLRAHLAAEAVGSYDKVHLSNLADWLSASEFDALLRTRARRIASPGRAVWRYLHTRRAVPEDLRGIVCADEPLGRRLADDDRFPFYGVVPLAIARP